MVFGMAQFKSKLAEEVYNITGENVYLCYFCGECSGGCPFAEFMDFLPHQAMKMIQLDDERVLGSKTIWYCASCFTCTSRCPRGLDITRVMEGLRVILLRRRKDAIDLRRVKKLEKLPQIAIVAGSRKYTG